MGTWTITIRGTGAHHNAAYPLDANRLAARFVDELQEAGHTVESAALTHGDGIDDLRDPVSYRLELEAAGRLGEPQTDEPMMQWFSWGHLPPSLQVVSRLFGDLAEKLVRTLPKNAERTVALRKLLEGKDAAVRARISK